VSDRYIEKHLDGEGSVGSRFTVALTSVSAPSGGEGTIFGLNSDQLDDAGTAMDSEAKQLAVERGNMRWQSVQEHLGEFANPTELWIGTPTHTNGVATAFDFFVEYKVTPHWTDNSTTLTGANAVKRMVATALSVAKTINRVTYANGTARTSGGGEGNRYRVESITSALLDTVSNIEGAGGNANIAVTAY
jgi:hypothetical protein